MDIQHKYFSNHFPYTNIEVAEFNKVIYLDYSYTEPNDRKYPKSTQGVWRIKYKTIDPGYWCEGQGLPRMKAGSTHTGKLNG